MGLLDKSSRKQRSTTRTSDGDLPLLVVVTRNDVGNTPHGCHYFSTTDNVRGCVLELCFIVRGP